MNMTQVLIAIQSRSTSTRLPGKCNALIGGKKLLDLVLESCVSSATYINRRRERYNVFSRVVLVVPEGDELEAQYKNRCPVISGSLTDVLSRYKKASDQFQADYIVRITGDCPLVPAHVISKHIELAIYNSYDYIGNCDPDCRTSMDGVDCEVFSSRLLNFMDENGKDSEDREHVTIYAKKQYASGDLPKYFTMGVSLGHFDLSNTKLSVDTAKDLEAVRAEVDSLSNKMNIAVSRYGKQHVHRF
jgi:spore coat polysaccharide biosynthesis protein SpsF (cytidylyltransferase family)